MREAKRCPYCLGEHERPRAVYCCPEHAQRAANERQRAAARLERSHARTMIRIRERAERNSAWRNALRIPGVEGVAAAIFGTAPAATVRHGDTLDG
jgi:hypothetical protein